MTVSLSIRFEDRTGYRILHDADFHAGSLVNHIKTFCKNHFQLSGNETFSLMAEEMTEGYGAVHLRQTETIGSYYPDWIKNQQCWVVMNPGPMDTGGQDA